MSPPSQRPARIILLGATIAVQVICAAFFLWDAAEDYIDLGQRSLDFHLSVEALSVLTLFVAIALEIGQFVGLMRRERHMMRGLTAAGRALHDLIEEHFAAWRLTPAERDWRPSSSRAPTSPRSRACAAAPKGRSRPISTPSTARPGCPGGPPSSPSSSRT